MPTENPRPQFDEQAALRALEQLRDQIQDARSRRQQKIAEFEAFVRSNRAASQAERLAALNELEGAAPAVQTAARTAERARDLPLPQSVADSPPRSTAPATPRLEHDFSAYAPSYELEPQRDLFQIALSIWRDRRYQIAGGLAAVILLMLLVARPWSDSPPDTASTSPSGLAGAAASQGTHAGSPAAAARAPSAAPDTSPRALQIELTTIRPVWMRVTVDGQRQVERQIPGGQKLGFGADRAIVLRAGDAGAVRLSVGGADRGLLGRDGQVVNRTLTPQRR